MTTRCEHLLGLYAQHNAGLQQLITSLTDMLRAYQDGSLTSPEKTLGGLIEDLEQEQASWQAQDTWGKGYEENDGDS